MDRLQICAEHEFTEIVKAEAIKRGVSVSQFLLRMSLDWLDVYYMNPFNRIEGSERKRILQLKLRHKAERK